MSDSEGEQKADKEKRIEDKMQLRKIEENDTKVDKKEKKKKRMESRNEKAGDSDSGSEIESEVEGEEGDEKAKKAAEEEDKGHAPLKKTDEEIKKAAFLGEKFGHFKIGTYIRIELKLDKGISRKLEPDYPIVLCSLKHQELSYAYMRVKIKKHRWYPHILKSRDPITISIGWRKFQSIPIYTMEDDSIQGEHKSRMIKYTPKFGFCYAVFYAPTFAVGTPFLGVQDMQEGDVSHFRVCTTGVVLEMNSHFKVMKKLKLIGEPYKVMRNTAFIKGMFTSDVEVAKFTGA